MIPVRDFFSIGYTDEQIIGILNDPEAGDNEERPRAALGCQMPEVYAEERRAALNSGACAT